MVFFSEFCLFYLSNINKSCANEWFYGNNIFLRLNFKTWDALCAKSLQSWLIFCNPMDYSPPGSSVHGIFQAIILEWVAMPSSRGSSPPRDRTHLLCLQHLTGGFFTTSATWEALSCSLVEYYSEFFCSKSCLKFILYVSSDLYILGLFKNISIVVVDFVLVEIQVL